MKLKQVYTMLLFCTYVFLHCTTANNKYFTGQVEYDYSYESSTLDTDLLSNARPAKSIFRYDLNNYQSQFLGKDTITYYYSGKLNKAVSAAKDQKVFECEDYGNPTDSILSFKVYDTDEKILGQECRILEFQSKLFWNRYYVSKNLRIAPATYQQHLAYNWSFYGEKANGGLILRLEHRFKTYVMKGTATKIINAGGSFKAFDLDKSVITEACNNK